MTNPAKVQVVSSTPSRDYVPDVSLLLLNNTGVGGTERRFAQVFHGLRQRNFPISLVVNESLLAGLIRAGVMGPIGPSDLVLNEPVGRLTRLWFRRKGRQEPPEGNQDLKVGAWGRVFNSLEFGLRKLDYAFASARVTMWLIRRRPKAIHLVLGGAYIVLPLQIAGWAPPAVVSVVGPKLREMVGSVLGLWLYRLALRWAHIVDALSDSIRHALVREGVPSERIVVSSGSGVDISRFRPAGDKKRWVVFVGRLLPEKNPLLFVESCALVHELAPAARFFILGEGPLEDEVVGRVRQRGLDSCFLRIGWCERVETILAESLIFVSLQRTDNYPSQALLEAMACGAAVVASDVGQTGRLVDEAVGVRVDAKPVLVADALIRLLDNPAQTAEMGRRGRERVVRQHSMETYLDYVEQIYTGLCREAPRA